ncbi:MAG: hypothetical protein ABI444_13065 [Candidatus Kapaibacterium sp.]|jgi:hypothetical protein
MTKYIFVVALLLVIVQSCATKDESNWVKSPGVTISAFKSDSENGNVYLQVMYENFGTDTIKRLKYELISRKGTQVDTSIEMIEPTKIFSPGDRHVVPRQIGQKPLDVDALKVGKVWVVKN